MPSIYGNMPYQVNYLEKILRSAGILSPKQ
jgi:hypothetical protein